MTGKIRARMPRSQRAKQFMPFAALKGLEAAIAAEEAKASRVAKVELDEWRVEEINQALITISKGSLVRVRHYAMGHYHDTSGSVDEIDAVRKLLVVDGKRIRFEDIFKIRVKNI